MSAPGLVCLKGWENDYQLEQKTSTGLKVSFTHQGNLRPHLLRVPCAVRSPFGNIKKKVHIHYFGEEVLKKLLAEIQMQHEDPSYFREKRKKPNLWRNPILFCFAPGISTCTNSWQYLDGNTKTTADVRGIARGVCGPQPAQAPHTSTADVPALNQEESTAHCRHQHTPSLRIDDSDAESVRNFHK